MNLISKSKYGENNNGWKRKHTHQYGKYDILYIIHSRIHTHSNNIDYDRNNYRTF